jgi:hypothetical protein
MADDNLRFDIILDTFGPTPRHVDVFLCFVSSRVLFSKKFHILEAMNQLRLGQYGNARRLTASEAR